MNFYMNKVYGLFAPCASRQAFREHMPKIIHEIKIWSTRRAEEEGQSNLGTVTAVTVASNGRSTANRGL